MYSSILKELIVKTLNRESTRNLMFVPVHFFRHAISVRIKIRFFPTTVQITTNIHCYTITVHSTNVDISLTQLPLKGLSTPKMKIWMP